MIVVDYREPEEIKDALRELSLTVVERNLLVGDYVISDIVVERKTVGDFENSIINGRLKKQVLLALEKYDRMILILEGDPIPKRLGMRQFYSMLSSLTMKYGVSIVPSMDLSSTVELLYAFYRHSKEKMLPKYFKAKRNPGSVEEAKEALILSLPNVGERLLHSVKERFSSVKDFVNAPIREFMKLPGVGEKKAFLFYKIFNEPFKRSFKDSGEG